MSAPDNRQMSWAGLIVAVVMIVAMIATGLVIAGKKFSVGPFAPTPTAVPTPEAAWPAVVPDRSQATTVIDYGRLTRPIPELRIEEPSGAFIVFVDTRASDYGTAIESLDGLIGQVVEPGDEWVYYFDTASDGSLFFIIRCQVSTLDQPIESRRCQTSQMQPGMVDALFLYERGFVSGR